MNILVLTSRYTATRDIIGEDFGRQTRLFEALLKYGHNITFFCADYRKFEQKTLSLHGIDVRIVPFGIRHFFRFISKLKGIMKSGKWDMVIATSDPLWGLIGYRYSRKYGIKFLYDLHDNYETYATYRLPLIPWLDKRVLKKAGIITVVSHELKEKISRIRKNRVYVIQNGFDGKIFHPIGMMKCRKQLNLPPDRKIIVYTGSLQRRQGIHILVESFNKLKKKEKNALLAISGRFFGSERKHLNLNHDGILYLGSLSQKETAKLINSADVAVIPNMDDDFTRYCFPYKLVEYAACGKPIVATDVGDVAKFIKNKQCLCRPNDSDDMSEKLLLQLHSSRKTAYNLSSYTWHNIAGKLNAIINLPLSGN